MIIFNTDLDNTLVFSNKYNIGNKKQCVEIYNGKEAGFITEYTDRLLEQVRKKVLIVPTTTRSVEQYRRIGLKFIPEYALVCNGGILLKDGQEEKKWYQESLQLLANCKEQLSMAERILKEDSNVTFDIRNIRELFIVTKSVQPLLSIHKLKEWLDSSKVDIFHQKQKVYVIPKKLDKGTAVNRLRKRISANYVIAAGDSEIDVSMLQKADLAFAPKKLKQTVSLPKDTILIEDNKVFSEIVLEYVLNTKWK